MPKQTISVIERRLQGPSVFRQSSQPIPLVEPKKWTLRWENSKISPDHMWDIIHVKGWEYAEAADIACPIDEVGGSVRDGKIVRGERGEEVLVKMLTRDWNRVQKMKDEQNRQATFGKKQLKKDIVSGVAEQHGDQAAEWISKNVNAVSVEDSRGPADE